MALLLLLGAVLLAATGGFLQAHESVFFLHLSWPFALGAVLTHAVAAIWSLRGRVDAPLERSRIILGVVVGLFGLIAGFSYGTNHQNWFGDRVTAVVSDARQVCGVNDPLCYTDNRLAAVDTGDDLGWAKLCGTAGPVGSRVDVDVDPLGWVPPVSPSCTTPRRWGTVLMALWLAGLIAIVAVRLIAALRPGPTGPELAPADEAGR